VDAGALDGWVGLALGLAPVLAALGAYELLFVWPLRRRLARIEAEAKALARASAAAPARLDARLDARIDTRVDPRLAAERAAALARVERAEAELDRLGDRLGRLELRGQSPAYEQAIDLAAKGGGAKRLVTYFGLSEGEATLVRRLHGKRNGVSAPAKPR